MQKKRNFEKIQMQNERLFQELTKISLQNSQISNINNAKMMQEKMSKLKHQAQSYYGSKIHQTER